ncbi:MAG: DUF262 domain-containing protein [Sphingomonadaceae bacterium]
MKLTPSEPDVSTIVGRIERGDIDLQPDFQRQEVWSVKKKKRLIDTILRGWSIPPVHFVILPDGQSEVLDGQQRLAAIRDFVGNRFSIDGNVTPHSPEIEDLHGRFYRNLDEVTRRKVDQYPLRCFRITEYSPEEPSELFYRLNQPTGLTAGEQRNALYGPARVQMKELVTFFEEQGNDKSTLGFSNLRLAYDDVIARLLYFVEAENFSAKSTESRISERFRQENPFAGEVYQICEYAIEAFSQMRAAAPPYRFNKASLLSWLLFISRFASDGEIVFDFMAMVLEGHEQSEIGLCSEALELFIDRASSRVTDVSSVVIRDFCLCYMFDRLTEGVLPDRVPQDMIEEVDRFAIQRPALDFESAVINVLDIEMWSQTL